MRNAKIGLKEIRTNVVFKPDVRYRDRCNGSRRPQLSTVNWTVRGSIGYVINLDWMSPATSGSGGRALILRKGTWVVGMQVEGGISARYSSLAPLNLLASCSLSWFGERALGDGREGGGSALGRLGGRSPLSWRIVTKVAQPGVLISCTASEGEWDVATRQRRDSSSLTA